MQEQAQATIVARVAYVLLHTFILSTVFRCKSDVDGSWISHMAYVAGFCAVLLVSNALYIALTLMDPGYIPAVQGLKLQVPPPNLLHPQSCFHMKCACQLCMSCLHHSDKHCAGTDSGCAQRATVKGWGKHSHDRNQHGQEHFTGLSCSARL